MGVGTGESLAAYIVAQAKAVDFRAPASACVLRKQRGTAARRPSNIFLSFYRLFADGLCVKTVLVGSTLLPPELNKTEGSRVRGGLQLGILYRYFPDAPGSKNGRASLMNKPPWMEWKEKAKLGGARQRHMGIKRPSPTGCCRKNSGS